MNNKITEITKPIQDRLACLLFIFFVPMTAHLLFSWIGFNLTDNGYVLAYSRRILEGEIPHRDFMLSCPPGSAFLHIPVVLFGGDYTFWLSRLFVWFQFGCIAWSWTVIIERLLKIYLNTFEKICFSIIAFAFSAHNFPIMAWSTIDGLFFTSIGLSLSIKESQRSKLFGYLFMGMAYLCRQSFLPMVFVSIVALGDWPKTRFWLAAVLPGIAYIFYIAVTKTLSDVMLQLSYHADLMYSGLIIYIVNKTMPLGALWGYLAASLTSARLKSRVLAKIEAPRILLGILMFYVLPFYSAIILTQGKRIITSAFVLFGAAAAAAVYFVMNVKDRTAYMKAGILVLLAAWCTSLSKAYHFPVLAAGPLAVLLIGYSRILSNRVDKNGWVSRAHLFLLYILVIITLFGFGIARFKHSYFIYLGHGEGVSEMNQPLDGIFPGASMIKTNLNTYRVLYDLRTAASKAGGQNYAIIPDICAYWVKSPQRNPLPVDWVGTYGEHKPSSDRIIKALQACRGSLVVLVEKVKVNNLSDGFMPIPYNEQCEPVKYVLSNFNKIDETEFFELYK